MTEQHDLLKRLLDYADIADDRRAGAEYNRMSFMAQEEAQTAADLRACVARIEALESRQRVLREALEPFAAEYEYWVKDVPERLMLSDGEGTLSPADIPWDAIVRARRALAGDAP